MVEVAREGIELAHMRLSRVFVEAPLALRRARDAHGQRRGAREPRAAAARRGRASLSLMAAAGSSPPRSPGSPGMRVTVAVGEARRAERESPLTLTLAQGISRGERMDLVVQKATELGVTTLAPLLTERSVVRLDAAQAARKSAHWRAIALAACEQSGRNRPPRLLPPATARAVPGRDGRHGDEAAALAGGHAAPHRGPAPGGRGAGAHRPRGGAHGRGTGARAGGRVPRRAPGAARAAHRDRRDRRPRPAAAGVRRPVAPARAACALGFQINDLCPNACRSAHGLCRTW